jgi:hypothetical protein
VVDFLSELGNPLSADTVTTDSSGAARVTLTGTQFGEDVLSATSLGEIDTAELTVTQDQFSFITPASGTEIPLNTTTAVTVEWLVDGQPQAGEMVSLFSTRGTLSQTNVPLDANGRASVQISSEDAGPAQLAAVNSNLTRIERGIEFVATEPTVLDLQASPFTVGVGEQSTIRATVKDASGNLVKNQFVEFSLVDVSGGSLSDGFGITNTFGRAEVTYTAGETVSGSGAVTITARVVGTTIEDSVPLTVAGEEVFLDLVTGNELGVPSTTLYAQPWTVIVTDIDGRGVAGADVTLSVVSLQYFKGFYERNADDQWDPQRVATCKDEDTKFCNSFQEREEGGDPRCRDGALDPEEDDPSIPDPNNPLEPVGNLSGIIEAGNVASVSPGVVTTNDLGVANFDLVYGQSIGNWAKVRLRAQATVAGTESSETREFILPVTVDDLEAGEGDPPGGQESRWGILPDCTTTQ